MSISSVFPGLYQEADSIERWNQAAQQADQQDQQGPAAASNGPVPAAAERTSGAVLSGSSAMHETPVSPQQKQQEAQQGHHQLNMEGIRGSFSPVAIFGIRSLPAALHPGYRQELLLQLQAAEKQRQRSNSHASSSDQQQQHQQQHTGSSSPSSEPQRGLKASPSIGKVPQRYGPLGGYFSCFQHVTSEYERQDLVEKGAKLQSKMAQMGVDDFVVRSCPPPVQHSTIFAVYQHDLAPFVEVDYMGRPLHSTTQQQPVRPFIPAGRTSPEVLLRGQVQDLLSALEAGLSSDWPRSFIKAFIDKEGSVVLCFDRAGAAAEGDLTSYLNHQEKHGSTMVEFKLTKDSERWGVLEGDGASVFYVLTPPWVRRGPGGRSGL